MRHRSRATLGPIVQGLLIAGLCTLAAAAQQAATPASPAAATLAQAQNTAQRQPEERCRRRSNAGGPDAGCLRRTKDTGVSNPDAVTPEASSTAADQAANGPSADSKPEQSSPQTGDAGTTPQPAMIPATAAAPARVRSGGHTERLPHSASQAIPTPRQMPAKSALLRTSHRSR